MEPAGYRAKDTEKSKKIEDTGDFVFEGAVNTLIEQNHKDDLDVIDDI